MESFAFDTHFVQALIRSFTDCSKCYGRARRVIGMIKEYPLQGTHKPLIGRLMVICRCCCCSYNYCTDGGNLPTHTNHTNLDGHWLSSDPLHIAPKCL